MVQLFCELQLCVVNDSVAAMLQHPILSYWSRKHLVTQAKMMCLTYIRLSPGILYLMPVAMDIAGIFNT